MYDFKQRREKVTIDGQTVHLIEPLEEGYQHYEALLASAPDQGAERGAILKEARVVLCKICLCDADGKNLIDTNQLTEIEIRKWPAHVTRTIEDYCRELIKECGGDDGQQEADELGEPTAAA